MLQLLGEYSFFGCSQLADVKLPDTLVSMEKGTFFNCAKLKNITIPKSVTSIGDSVFENCYQHKWYNYTL